MNKNYLVKTLTKIIKTKTSDFDSYSSKKLKLLRRLVKLYRKIRDF